MIKILKNRLCSICGKKFDVKLGLGGKIPDEFFFTRITFEPIKGGTNKLLKRHKPRKNQHVEEYWECRDCLTEGTHKSAKEETERFMNLWWGKRCPDYEPRCALCKAWKAFDYLFEWDE